MWKLFLFAISIPCCASFNLPRHASIGLRNSPLTCAMVEKSAGSQIQLSALSRRGCLQSVLLGGSTLLFGTQAFAEKDVADGGLPAGALEFNRFLLSQKQWDDITKRVETGHAEMDDAEWQNVQGYLRKLYAAGDDMVSLAKSFDKDRQDKVADIAKSFRKAVKAADKPASKRDWESFLTSQKEVSGYLSEFMRIRAESVAVKSDIPDEI